MKPSNSFLLMVVAAQFLLLFAGCPASKPTAESKIEKRSSSIPIRFHLASRDAVEGYREAIDERGGKLFTAPDPVLTETDIETADVKRYPAGDVGVLVTLSEEGGKRMHETTSTNINKVIAIFIEDKLVMSATIMDPVGSSIVITGQFSVLCAQEIVDSLKGETRK